MKTLLFTVIAGVAVVAMLAGCGKKTENTAQQGDTTQVAEPSVAQPEPSKQEVALKEEPKKAEAPAVPKERKITIPDSTQLQVSLTDSVQTNSNQVGDHFTGTLAQAIEVSGKTVFPQGSTVDMVITKLVKGGTLKTSPEIGFTIEKVTLPDGKSYKVASDEYYDKGRSHTRREVGMIGGGAAAGAIVGALAGKGKGAIIGAATGAAAGTGLAAATGRQNLVYGPGQTVTFRTTQPVSVTVPNR